MAKSSSWFVGISGVAMVGVSIVGLINRLSDSTVIAFVLAGAALIVISPVLSKLESFEFGPTRAAATFFRNAEEDIEKGNVIEAGKAVQAVEFALNLTPKLGAEAVVTPGNVVITSVAMATLTRLSDADRAAVESALRTLGTTDDPRAIEPGSGGRSYFVHKVNPGLRIYYRPLDKPTPDAPDKYVVVGINV